MAFTTWVSGFSGLSPKEFNKNILNEGNPPSIDDVLADARTLQLKGNTSSLADIATNLINGKYKANRETLLNSFNNRKNELIDTYSNLSQFEINEIKNKQIDTDVTGKAERDEINRQAAQALVDRYNREQEVPTGDPSQASQLFNLGSLAGSAALPEAQLQQRLRLANEPSLSSAPQRIRNAQVTQPVNSFPPGLSLDNLANTFKKFRTGISNFFDTSGVKGINYNRLGPMTNVALSDWSRVGSAHPPQSPREIAEANAEAQRLRELRSGRGDYEREQQAKKQLAKAAAKAGQPKGQQRMKGPVSDFPIKTDLGYDPLLDHGRGMDILNERDAMGTTQTESTISPDASIESDRTRRTMPDYLKRAIGSFGFNTLGVPFLLSRANRLRGEAQNLRKILGQQTPERRVGLSQLPIRRLPDPSIAVAARQRGSDLLSNTLGQTLTNIEANRIKNRFALQNEQFIMPQIERNRQVANQEAQLQHQTNVGRDRFENQLARNFAGRELYGYSMPQRDDAISGALSSIIGAGKRAGQIYNRGKKGLNTNRKWNKKERKALKTLGLI